MTEFFQEAKKKKQQMHSAEVGLRTAAWRGGRMAEAMQSVEQGGGGRLSHGGAGRRM